MPVFSTPTRSRGPIDCAFSMPISPPAWDSRRAGKAGGRWYLTPLPQKLPRTDATVERSDESSEPANCEVRPADRPNYYGYSFPAVAIPRGELHAVGAANQSRHAPQHARSGGPGASTWLRVLEVRPTTGAGCPLQRHPGSRSDTALNSSRKVRDS